jgi:multiple sugar transport system permease protein
MKRFFGYVALAATIAIFLYPIWWMVIQAFRPGAAILGDPLGAGPFTLKNFTSVFDRYPVGTAMANTALVVAVKGAITMVFCPLAGYGFAKYDFRFKEALFGLVLLTLMLPVLTLVIPLLLEMKQLGWVNTYQALILPGSVDAFSVYYMRQTISQVPDELLDAAALDGAGTLRTFWSVVVPVIRPGLAALAVLTFFNIYNDLVWPIVAVNDPQHQTISVLLKGIATNVSGATSASGFDLWGQLMAVCTIATVPTVIIFLLVQKHFVKGLLAGSSR